MTQPSSQAEVELSIPGDDLILPFQAEQADVAGRLVKLGPVVDTILSRHAYPEPVSQLLGEAVALTALLGAALKFEGKFILQASTDGPVDLLVADYQVPGALRGYARFSTERLHGAPSRRSLARPRPSRHDHRPRHGHRALPGRGAARRRGPGRCRRHLFPAVGAAPDLHQACRGAALSGRHTGSGPGPGAREGFSCRSSRARAVARLRANPPSPRRTGRAPRRLPRRSRITSCSIRCCRPTGCSTVCSTRSRCAPIAPSRSRAIAAARGPGSRNCSSASRPRILTDMVVDGEVCVTCEFCNSRYRFDPATFADA